MSKPSIQELYDKLQNNESNQNSFKQIKFLQEHFFSISFEFPNKDIYAGGTYSTFIEDNVLVNFDIINRSSDLLDQNILMANIYNYYKDNNGSITPFIRSVSLPSFIARESSTKIETPFGIALYPDFGDIKPERNYFTLSVLSTESQFIEYLFLTWLEQTRSTRWIHDEFPFEKANMIVDFYDQKFDKVLLSYKFHECFPILVDTIDPSHDFKAGEGRDVQFAFNYVTYSGKLSHISNT